MMRPRRDMPQLRQTGPRNPGWRRWLPSAARARAVLTVILEISGGLSLAVGGIRLVAHLFARLGH